MTMLPADWALAAVTVALAILGLFRGFSGALAFSVSMLGAGVTAAYGWGLSAQYLHETWQRGGAVLVAALLVFGIVRVIVKKLVNGLLAQPTDAILGFAVGALTGALIAFAWAKMGLYLEYSSLVTELSRYVG